MHDVFGIEFALETELSLGTSLDKSGRTADIESLHSEKF